MKIRRIASPEITRDFDAALWRALEVAAELLGDNMLLSWYDRERALESPLMPAIATRVAPPRAFWITR